MSKISQNYIPSVSSTRSKEEVPSCILKPLVKIFQCVYDFFSRYCGSKLSCGYQFGFEKTLTKKEAEPFLPYVSAAAYAFNGKSEEFLIPLGLAPISPSELGFSDPELICTKYACFDKRTGLKISFVEKGDEILIAIPGVLSSAGNEKDEKSKDYRNGLFRDPAKAINILGGVPYVYLQAERVIASLLTFDRFKGKNITLVGQCFGGSIASYVALRNKMKAVCFNSFQLGAGLQARIGDKTLKDASSYITHFCVERDWLTTSKTIGIADRILSTLRIRTPGNFGKKYLIPSAYQSSRLSHGFVLGSLMHYLGHDKRATPKSLWPNAKQLHP